MQINKQHQTKPTDKYKSYKVPWIDERVTQFCNK